MATSLSHLNLGIFHVAREEFLEFSLDQVWVSQTIWTKQVKQVTFFIQQIGLSML